MKEINTENWRNDFSVEYYLIKKATSKARRKFLLKTILFAALLNVVGFIFMYGILELLLYIHYEL